MLARRFDRVKLRVRPLHAVQVDGVDLPHPPQIVESAVALADSDTRLLLRHIVSPHRVMRRFAYGRPDQIRKKVAAKARSAAPRSEERREGKECVSTGRSRGDPDS